MALKTGLQASDRSFGSKSRIDVQAGRSKPESGAPYADLRLRSEAPVSTPGSEQSGQATVEYILLLAVVASICVTVAAAIGKMGMMQKMMAPITNDFAHAYQNGRKDALGFDDKGGPQNHPRVTSGQGNFRIFINPKF